MKSVLFRTGSGSIPVQTPVIPGSPRVSNIGKVFNVEKKKKKKGSRSSSSPMISLSIRRTSSESDVIGSAIEGSGVTRTLSKLGSLSLPAVIPEEDCGNSELEILRSSIGSLSLTEDRQRSGIPMDELGYLGGGIGKNRKFGGGCGDRDESSDPRKLGEYYKEMLTADPMNSLLLRNYGKYLHEVERDYVKAEECYGRAILANPGDGEVLSLYGKLVWETQRDESRAKSYFDQAVHASPDDCTVLGSYARFVWEAEEEEDDDKEEVEKETVAAGAAMIAAY
ncbi:uncharacterized protein LOC132635307 [Lycium barbarum]|uniref:uncharacterized protein LOC132635307 n=1 Tax=Lycium barbarum TaxID=112863 RepID=UPI00293ED38D|nr:uncharacterized protein LOC132635307 [Lycium barbarum]